MKYDLNQKNILLLCPSFFGYELSIANTLKKLGAKEVVYLNDDPAQVQLFLIESLNHFHLPTSKQIRRFENKIYRKIKDKKFDIVLTVCGWALTSYFFEKIKKNNINENGRMILYYWDSLKLLKDDINRWSYFDDIFTFDNSDYCSNKDKMKFLPLFYVDGYKRNEQTLVTHDLITIGSFKMNRYFEIEKLIKNNPLIQIKSIMFAKKSILIHKLFRPKYKKVNLKRMTFKQLNKEEIISQYSGARAVLDIPKQGQNGLTMRIFESLALGKKIVTTNENIKLYDFYNQNYIFVIQNDGLLPSKEWFERDAMCDYDAIRKYSLENWVINLLFKNEGHYDV